MSYYVISLTTLLLVTETLLNYQQDKKVPIQQPTIAGKLCVESNSRSLLKSDVSFLFLLFYLCGSEGGWIIGDVTAVGPEMELIVILIMSHWRNLGISPLQRLVSTAFALLSTWVM